MTAKRQQRASADLSIELTKISTAFSIMQSMLSDLPDSQQKKALWRLCEDGKRAHERAFDHVQTIALHASLI